MSKSHPNELPIPPIAQADERARELLRIWAAKGKDHVTLATGLWEDPACWGIMLVDLIKHVANAYVQTRGDNREKVLARVKEGFDAEWLKATDKPKGGLLE